MLLLCRPRWRAGLDWDEAIKAAARQCQGAFSLVIGTPDALYGLRDGHGLRPLVFGSLPEAEVASWVLSSESCGLDIVGARFHDDVAAGELVRFHSGEAQPFRSRWIEETPKLCVFELIYFARPDSRFLGNPSTATASASASGWLQESPVEADLVIGVPDSGIPAAIGYSQASGIPFGDGLIKNRYVGRTFIQPTKAMREAGIRVKLNPLPDVLEGSALL